MPTQCPGVHARRRDRQGGTSTFRSRRPPAPGACPPRRPYAPATATAAAAAAAAAAVAAAATATAVAAATQQQRQQPPPGSSSSKLAALSSSGSRGRCSSKCSGSSRCRCSKCRCSRCRCSSNSSSGSSRCSSSGNSRCNSNKACSSHGSAAGPRLAWAAAHERLHRPPQLLRLLRRQRRRYGRRCTHCQRAALLVQAGCTDTATPVME